MLNNNLYIINNARLRIFRITIPCVSFAWYIRYNQMYRIPVTEAPDSQTNLSIFGQKISHIEFENNRFFTSLVSLINEGQVVVTCRIYIFLVLKEVVMIIGVLTLGGIRYFFTWYPAKRMNPSDVFPYTILV